jgi:RNA polymerase sigma-70 factor, ECF subfamily
MTADRADIATDEMLLSGGATQFAAFYRVHESAVLRYFARRTRRPDVAADLTAETFARALAGRQGFDPARGEARGWLFGIARHVLAQSLEHGRVESETRKRLKMEPLVLDDALLARIDELAGDATAELEAIADDQRVAVRGRILDDLEYPVLAAQLRCSEAVVRQRVSRGLRALRARLESQS